MRVNGFYLLTILLFITLIYVSIRFFRGSADAVIGLSKTKEYKINSEKSAIVKWVKVVPGMQVKEGDALLELTSPELEMDIAKLSSRISLLTSEQREKVKLAEARIAYINAEFNIVTEKLESEVKQTMNELVMNKALTQQFVATEREQEESPLQLQLNSLKQQMENHRLAKEIKTRDIRQEQQIDQLVLANQITLLSSELKMLQHERKNLVKVASAPGVVENVYVKANEHVDAYSSLLQINPIRPTAVVAYVIGKKNDRFPVGDTVTVSSYNQLRSSVSGTVIGYGSVVELPEILQKSTATRAFGQEIFIEILPNNTLANGEKVLVR